MNKALRVFDSSGKRVGTGFAARWNHDGFLVLTCGHLLHDNEPSEFEQTFYVETEIASERIAVKLVHWCYDRAMHRDIAVLTVEPSAKLHFSESELFELNFTMTNFSDDAKFVLAGHPDAEGAAASEVQVVYAGQSRILERSVAPHYINFTKQTGYTFTGFSGGPIIERESGCVVAVAMSEMVKDGSGNGEIRAFPLARMFESLHALLPRDQVEQMLQLLSEGKSPIDIGLSTEVESIFKSVMAERFISSIRQYLTEFGQNINTAIDNGGGFVYSNELLTKLSIKVNELFESVGQNDRSIEAFTAFLQSCLESGNPHGCNCLTLAKSIGDLVEMCATFEVLVDEMDSDDQEAGVQELSKRVKRVLEHGPRFSVCEDATTRVCRQVLESGRLTV